MVRISRYPTLLVASTNLEKETTRPLGGFEASGDTAGRVMFQCENSIREKHHSSAWSCNNSRSMKEKKNGAFSRKIFCMALKRRKNLPKIDSDCRECAAKIAPVYWGLTVSTLSASGVLCYSADMLLSSQNFAYRTNPSVECGNLYRFHSRRRPSSPRYVAILTQLRLRPPHATS